MHSPQLHVIGSHTSVCCMHQTRALILICCLPSHTYLNMLAAKSQWQEDHIVVSCYRPERNKKSPGMTFGEPTAVMPSPHGSRSCSVLLFFACSVLLVCASRCALSLLTSAAWDGAWRPCWPDAAAGAALLRAAVPDLFFLRRSFPWNPLRFSGASQVLLVLLISCKWNAAYTLVPGTTG